MQQGYSTFKLAKLPIATLLFMLLFGVTMPGKAQTGMPVFPAYQPAEDSIKGFMAKYNVPGLTIAIAKYNQIVFMRSYGWSDSAHVVAMQPYNMGRIMSVSKVVTWSAIMKCVDLGLIPNTNALVFDPTNGILGQEPYVKGQYTDTRINTITVQNLLDMVAGWNDSVNYLPDYYPPYYDFQNMAGDPINWPLSVSYYLGVPNPVTKQNYITFLLRHGLDDDPGANYSYSNTGFTMLGRVVEKLSGMTYEQFVQTYLAAPSGVCDMHVAKTFADQAYEREMYYNDPYMNFNSYGDGTWVPDQYGGREIADMDAHGGWVVTARDMLRYFAGLQNQLTPSSYATVPTSWTGAIEGTNAVWANDVNVQFAMIINKRVDALSAQASQDVAGNLPTYCIDVIGNSSSVPSYDLSKVPTVAASGITFPSVQSNNFTLNWTSGNGTGRIVIASADTVVNAFPLDGTDYTANAAFGSGTNLGNNNYVVYNGTGSIVNVTGLTPGIKYYFRVVEYNENTATGNYPLYTLCDCGMADMVYGLNMTSGSDTAICAGSTMTVNYLSNGTTYNSGNAFTAQLSDANGSFASPVNIGTLNSTSASGSLTATIPSNTPAGYGYLIRINSSNPANTGLAGDTGIHVSALQTWYQDADGDGFGNPSVSMQSCTQPVGYVLNNLDCNDANAGINPYAVEVCGNGIDDNCDGYTDQAINKALNFDGVDDVVIVQSSQMPQTSTWEAWINTTSASEMFIIQFERPDYAYIFLQNGQLGYGKTQNGLNYAWVGGPNLADGNWHHVAMVRSPGLINLYADGNYLYNLELTDTILAYMLTIGDMAEGGEAFNGSIDEVRIWNTALTQQQIQASMNIKLDGNETNLYRYYDFDEGIPGANNNGIVSLRDRMIDSSNNGTLMNFALTGSTSNWINSWTYPAMYADHDGDGFGSGTAWTCGSMHGLVNNNLDCNDNDASINPYAIEICGNGIDDNCDGNIDFEVNKALNFDGVNDHVSVPVWSFNPPFTLEVWINTTSGSSTMNLMAWEGVDYAQLFIQNGYPGYSENFSGWAGGWNIADGNWHHLAVVRTASAVTMFIDGSEAWSNSISNTPSTSTLTLGDWSNGGLPYSGSMDEVRIWSTALSQRQIQATMNRKLDGNEANLVRYYTFDEGKPGQDNVGISSLRDRIVDSSNNATLENFALTGSNSNWVSSWAYPTLYADNDGDGFGAGNAWTCGSMTGWVANDLDCTDNNAAVNPRAQELVDGVDNNCNGAIDENSALNFNGTNNYAQLSWFERPDSMTAEFWIKTTENSSNQEDILSWIGYANGQSFTELALVNGGLYYDETNNGAGYAMGYYAINDGNWHHVALIRNPSLIYIYVDGVLRLANSFNMPSSTNVFNLGFFDWSADSTSPAPDRYLNGTVDELRVYSEVRSQSQIQADMICGDIGPATNLLCYYDFNQGVPNGNNADYTNIYDYSGHLGTGSLHNFSLTGTSSNFVAGEPAPILVVAGKGLTILNKENSPLLTNNTDFGPVNLNTPAVNTFTLKNTGSANLTVNSITSAGTNQTEFVTSGITLPAAIASGDSITFTVTFTPTANGIRSTVIHVSNTTCQQGDYYFDVQGTGGAAINQWTGAGGNSLWSTAANWSANSVPNDCSANVLIASATGNNWPTITTPVNVGSFTMTAGSITLSDTLSICGNVTGTSSGNLPQVTGGGVLALTGSSQQTISGKLQAVNVKINNTAGVVMQSGSSVYVSNILELQSGNLNTTAGTLTLTSTSANQIGIIDNFSQGYAGTITGNIVAQRYFDASLYAHQHLIGSPVYNPTMSQLSPTGAAGYIEDHDCDETQSDNGTPYGNIFSYNESHGSVCEIQSWYVETNGTRTLNPGEGYSYLNIGAGTISLTGVPNLNSSYGVSASVNGGVSSPLTNGGWSAQYTLQHRPMLSGFNLIANPYPAPVVIGLQSDQSTNNSTFGSKVYVFETEGTRQGSYMATDTIAPFQAFMVQRTSPGSGGTYTIFGSDRVRSSASFYRQYTDNQLNITSTNSATGLIDETTIAFNSASTNNYDPVYDAYKIPGALNRHTMYTLNNNNWMSINTLTSIEETGTVAMGFEPGVSGTYTLSFDGINTFDPTCYIMLEDLQTGTMYNIRNGAYTFTSNIADDWNRFVLHFTPPAEILSTDATCEAPGEINIVQAGNATWNYLVKDENNKVTANGILNNTNLISISANVGIYTLTLTDTSGYTVMKNIQVGGVQRVIAAFATSTTTAQVQENITFNSDSANVTSYSWDFGDGSTAVGITSSHIYQVQGVYNVVLMVKGEGGCVSSTAKNITVTSRSITGIQDVTKGKLNIWSHGNVVYIDFSDQGNVEAEIEMYDVLGQLLSSDKFGSSTVYTKQIGNTEAAYIIVKVKNDECVTTKKVFISNLDK